MKNLYYKFYKPSVDIEERSLSKKIPISLYSTTKGLLFCSRVLGMLPLSGLTNQTSEKLRCTFWSPYTIYYVLSLFGQILMIITTFNYLSHKGISLENITHLFLYISTLSSLLILTQKAGQWPLLIKKVEEIENKLPPLQKNFSLTVAITMAFVTIIATVEEILFVLYRLGCAYICNPDNIAEYYGKLTRPWIFNYTSFTMWKIIFCEVFSFQSTFLWSYNDMLLMVTSLYLTEHFTVHYKRLKKAVHEKHFLCEKFRNDYLKIVQIVGLLNVRFGTLLMTSVAVNVYWICKQMFFLLNKDISTPPIACKIETLQNSKNQNRPDLMDPAGSGWTENDAELQSLRLLHTVPAAMPPGLCRAAMPPALQAAGTSRAMPPSIIPVVTVNSEVPYGVSHLTYFIFSFTFLVIRTLLVLFLAARVHSNALAPVHILYDLPTFKFTIEVQKYISQIRNVKVAISGLDFFYVSKGMILSLAGSIITYELVLLQIHK